MADDAGQIAILQALHFGRGSDVRGVLTATAICAVASGAVGGKDGSTGLLSVKRGYRQKCQKGDANRIGPVPAHVRTGTSARLA